MGIGESKEDEVTSPARKKKSKEKELEGGKY